MFETSSREPAGRCQAERNAFAQAVSDVLSRLSGRRTRESSASFARGPARARPLAASPGHSGSAASAALLQVPARCCSQKKEMEHYRSVIKVAFIGAGSIEFTRNVVTDLCGYRE